jgi:nucleotide-binding universal stress UspA family protein
MSHQGILVGVDGSSQSDIAVRWAAREAVMRDEQLTLVHVVSPLTGDWSPAGTMGGPLPEQIDEWQQEEARRMIQDAIRIARETPAGDALRIQTETPCGPVVPVLRDLSKQFAIIVVGSRGQGKLARAVLGSVSTALVHHAHCPVAVLAHEMPPERRRAPVVVGIDGSPASEGATALAFDEASWRNVELVAVHAWIDAEWPGELPLPWANICADADETLAQRLAGWQERYPDVVVRRMVVRDDSIGALLAQSESAQLVVVGSHGRGGFAGMLLGSVSSAVVHGAHTPVIVVRQG